VLLVAVQLAARASNQEREMFSSEKVTLLSDRVNELLSCAWFFLILHQPTENCYDKFLILSLLNLSILYPFPILALTHFCSY
jgi:hypothetical protein